MSEIMRPIQCCRQQCNVVCLFSRQKSKVMLTTKRPNDGCAGKCRSLELSSLLLENYIKRFASFSSIDKRFDKRMR